MAETGENAGYSFSYNVFQKASLSRSLKQRIAWYYQFPKQEIFYSSKLKEFADDNSKFDENDRQFSKRVKNTYKQFLLFPLCFQRVIRQTCKKQGLFSGKQSPKNPLVRSSLQKKTLIRGSGLSFFVQL